MREDYLECLHGFKAQKRKEIIEEHARAKAAAAAGGGGAGH